MVETFVLSVDGPLRSDRYEIAHCGCCEVSETAEGRLLPFLLLIGPNCLSLSYFALDHTTNVHVKWVEFLMNGRQIFLEH